MNILFRNQLLLKPLAKEFNNGVCVPLLNAQRFHNLTFVAEKFNKWVRPTRVPHFQARKSARQIALHKG